MTAIYVDTSVLGAYYCPEPLSDRAQEYLRATDELAVSGLAEVEFFSLVSKKKRQRDFGEAKARRILMQFQSHLEEGYFYRLAVEPYHYLLARDMIAEFSTGLRTLDALHLAVVMDAGIALTTADVVMGRAARHRGIETDLIS